MRTTVTIDDKLYAQALEIIEPNFVKHLRYLFEWGLPNDLLR